MATNNFDTLEDELRFIFDTRKKSYPNNTSEFLKRLGQIYLLGTISEEAFNIAKNVYSKKSSSTTSYSSDPCGVSRRSSPC